MSFSKKLTSVLLSLCMVVSVLSVAIVPAAADTTYETYAQETVRGSNILHCFNWSYNQIKSNLADIAKAGYTAVQTSPVQRPKDYNASWTNTSGQWWKLYQPLGFSIAADGTTWLGTKAELTSLCTEAKKYNIKVVVDIVANHLANNGTDGGTYSYINSGIESDLKNANYYHTNNTRVNDDNRYNITQYHLGMPDLNTGNSYVQQRALGLLEECIDCGVDGFRFDAAKHIEVPNDPSNCRSNFWPTVINGAKSYASSKGEDEPFFYGEILGGAGTDISNYTQYMAVTDNYTGDLALDKAYWAYAPELADGTYHKGASASDSVLWVESHDTYMGESGSAWTKNTSSVESNIINRAWAIVGARAESTALFFARPNSTMGYASTDGNWKSKAVSEVNKFKSHFDGTNEYLSSSGDKVAYIERGTKGVVISKLDGGGQVSLTAHQMEDGTYKDQVSGGTFTVTNGVISGNVDSQGVAVVYNADESVVDYIENDTLYFKPNSNWTQASARFAMYVYNSSTGADAWADLTDSDADSYYSADVPSGDWTNVIFVRMNPSSNENRWDAYEGENHVWNKTNDLFPDDNTNCYTVADGAWTQGDGSWSLYSDSPPTTAAPTTVAPTTVAPSTAEPTTPSSDTITIYAINNANWSKVNVHYWGDGETDWPGAAMTSISGKKVYSFEVPKNVSGIVFTNGASSSTKQTGNITSGITDGATWIIGSASSNNYPVSVAPDYYLVGTMNNWSNKDNYKFSISATDSGKLEYKLSDVQLAANAEFKVHSNTGSWYPSGSNHTVSAAGTYDIYFRPNGDGDSAWLVDSSDSSKKYVYPANVTPYTITWKDGDGETLKTETVTHGNTPQYTGDTPTKTATDQYTYTFNNTWSPAVEAATADATYTAQFTPTTRTYTVTWKNYDGTTLDTDTVEYGATPSYDGETPTRPNNGATTYTFSGWSPEITDQTTVTGDVTYTARFSENLQTYTITWKDGDGETLKTETCIQGVTPQYTGDTPTKTATAQYSYSFNDTWDPPVAAADRDTTYTAQFDSTVNKYTITWKDGNGDTLKTNEVEYGTTPAYNGTTPTKYADANYTYSFNGTWSPAITSVTQNATYTAQFDATPIPTYTVYATNVVDWSNVYLYYWTDFGDNSWPGVKMTPDDDNFIWSAEIPATAKGIVFTNGGSDIPKQTVNIESGITDGAHWAILNEKDTNETEKYKIHAVPTYYLVGTMTDWGTTNAPIFTPIRNENKLEEYKATNVGLSKDTQIKVYSSNDAWYPSGDNYTVSETGVYDIYFRPNYDGNNDWYKSAFYLVNVSEYEITWKDGDGNTLKTETVKHGDTPEYTGTTPTKTATDQYTYTFNNTWSPEIAAATADATYTAQFTPTVKSYTVTWLNYDGTELASETYNYGDDPIYKGDTPTKAYDDDYSYTFNNTWSPQVVSVTGNASYTAQFDQTAHSFEENWTWVRTGNSYAATLTLSCDCGYSVDIPSTSITSEVTTPATCTENGIRTYTATVQGPDGNNYSDTKDEEIPASGHNMTAHPAHSATCTEAGNSEYWSCDRCNKYFSDENGWYEITENSWEIAMLGHNMTYHPAHDATCTEAGNSAYWSCDRCNKYFSDQNGNNEIQENSWVIPANGHTYGQPAWNWAADHKSATAAFTCNSGDDTQNIRTTDITIDYQAYKTIYTAHAVFNNTEYTDTVEDDAKLFAGHSLTLEGDIGVNFFINVSEEDVDSGVTVNFTWTVAGNEKHASYTLDKTRDSVKDHRYKATCYVAAAEMTYPITAAITINNELQEETNTYTVKQYAEKILTDQRFINSYTNTYGAAKYNKLNTLVKSMLDYGTRAQISFDRTDPGLANGGEYYLDYAVNASDIEAPVNSMSNNLSTYGLEYAGSTVVYLSETTLRHYYRITNTDTFNIYKNSIKMDGEAIKYKTSDDGMIYFDVKNISANDMGVTHTLTIGNNSYQYSVLTYIKKAIDRQTTSENTKEICKAAYRYYTAAVDYFA